MSVTKLDAPKWHLRREASGMELQLTGDWIARQTGIRSKAEVHQISMTLVTWRYGSIPVGLANGTVALIAFLKPLRETISKRRQPSI